tara:strand:- start:156 stop:854 length:699 start_codon:yes stop_codon:yes gene_type:complete
MTVTKTILFDSEYVKLLDNNLELSVSKNTKVGNELSRTKLVEMVQPDLHSTLLNGKENVTTNGQNYILTEGKKSITWEWDEEPITESDLDELTTYINSLDETVQIFRDFENKTYKVTFEYLGENSSWNPISFAYGLKVHKAKVKIEQDDSILFCIQRKNNITDWNIRHIDLSPGQVFDVEKIESNVCYVLFSQAVSVGGTAVDKHECRKQTSASIEVTNTSSKPCKVIQIYK